MRKSGWTVAAGLSSLVLLLTACGGSSSSTSTTGVAPGTATQGTASTSSGSASSVPASSAASSPKSTASARATSSSSSPAPTSEARPSSNAGVLPAGTTVIIVQHSNLGWVMATAKGIVVYTYAKDSKGGPPTCTGPCAAVWAPVTGIPRPGPVDTFPGTFGTVTLADGTKQITYNGYPLYTLKGAGALTTRGNGIEGLWHVILLSASNITA